MGPWFSVIRVAGFRVIGNNGFRVKVGAIKI